jgi:HlyD family secretion protein
MPRNVCIPAAIVMAALVAGCTDQPRPAASAGPSAAAPAITIVKPERRPVKRVIEQPGSVHAFEETILIPKVPGYVRELAGDPNKKDRPAHDRAIDIGSRVAKDQVLAELAVPELDEEMKQKEALVRQAEAEVTQAKKAVAAASAGVEAAKANVAETKAAFARAQALFDRWQSEASRVARLVTGGVIDTQSRDETLNQFKAAEALRAEAMAKVASSEAAVTKADADRDKSVADVAAAVARLDVAKSDANRIEALRKYLHIKAPYAGIVTRRAVNTGDYVAADGKHGLFAVARIDPVRIVVNVPEADSGMVESGQVVQVSLPASAGSTATGTVVRTSWSLDPGSRTLRTEIDLPNPDGKLRPGMYVNAKLSHELPAGWSIPVAAIGKVNEESVVYFVENGKALRVAVQLARGDAQFTQVRTFKRPGTTEWVEFTGNETIASPAAALSDGQAIP